MGAVLPPVIASLSGTMLQITATPTGSQVICTDSGGTSWTLRTLGTAAFVNTGLLSGNVPVLGTSGSMTLSGSIIAPTFKGSSTSSTLNLNTAGLNTPATQITFGNGGNFLVGEATVASTDDLFFQLNPKTGAWGYFEAYTGNGLVIGTGGATPIAFRTARVERARITSDGFGVNVTPTGNLHVGLSGIVALKSYVASSGDEGLVVNAYEESTSGSSRRMVDFAAKGIVGGSAGGSVIRFLTNPTSSTTGVERLKIDQAGQISISGPTFLVNQSSAPATPSGGGVLYTESGSLKYKGSSGTVTTLGAA